MRTCEDVSVSSIDALTILIEIVMTRLRLCEAVPVTVN